MILRRVDRLGPGMYVRLIEQVWGIDNVYPDGDRFSVKGYLREDEEKELETRLFPDDLVEVIQ